MRSVLDNVTADSDPPTLFTYTHMQSTLVDASSMQSVSPDEFDASALLPALSTARSAQLVTPAETFDVMRQLQPRALFCSGAAAATLLAAAVDQDTISDSEAAAAIAGALEQTLGVMGVLASTGGAGGIVECLAGTQLVQFVVRLWEAKRARQGVVSLLQGLRSAATPEAWRPVATALSKDLLACVDPSAAAANRRAVRDRLLSRISGEWQPRLDSWRGDSAAVPAVREAITQAAATDFGDLPLPIRLVTSLLQVTTESIQQRGKLGGVVALPALQLVISIFERCSGGNSDADEEQQEQQEQEEQEEQWDIACLEKMFSLLAQVRSCATVSLADEQLCAGVDAAAVALVRAAPFPAAWRCVVALLCALRTARSEVVVEAAEQEAAQLCAAKMDFLNRCLYSFACKKDGRPMDIATLTQLLHEANALLAVVVTPPTPKQEQLCRYVTKVTVTLLHRVVFEQRDAALQLCRGDVITSADHVTHLVERFAAEYDCVHPRSPQPQPQPPQQAQSCTRRRSPPPITTPPLSDEVSPASAMTSSQLTPARTVVMPAQDTLATPQAPADSPTQFYSPTAMSPPDMAPPVTLTSTSLLSSAAADLGTDSNTAIQQLRARIMMLNRQPAPTATAAATPSSATATSGLSVDQLRERLQILSRQQH
eukprot:TRINITY_DN4357_c0_g1_i1.p1 TRINITY_DN4357_c0_g1~~TRINITY_DN4357_c0_g1_i1.p1  ORF type:complete len:655 (+),score=167.18 TRINITY_DN4357_c0_g1_i1:65-2029(+)